MSCAMLSGMWGLSVSLIIFSFIALLLGTLGEGRKDAVMMIIISMVLATLGISMIFYFGQKHAEECKSAFELQMERRDERDQSRD